MLLAYFLILASPQLAFVPVTYADLMRAQETLPRVRERLAEAIPGYETAEFSDVALAGSARNPDRNNRPLHWCATVRVQDGFGGNVTATLAVNSDGRSPVLLRRGTPTNSTEAVISRNLATVCSRQYENTVYPALPGTLRYVRPTSD